MGTDGPRLGPAGSANGMGPAPHEAQLARWTTSRASRSEHLRPDCANCRAWCCVAPAFYAHQGFGFDKAAHAPCRHLSAGFRCAIHERLGAGGFPACETFDCFGAGQRITRLFGGQSWRSAPELAGRMFDAYCRYRALHELLALLDSAIQRVTPHAALALRELRQSLDDQCESGAAMANAFSVTALREQVLALIRQALSWVRPCQEDGAGEVPGLPDQG